MRAFILVIDGFGIGAMPDCKNSMTTEQIR